MEEKEFPNRTDAADGRWRSHRALEVEPRTDGDTYVLALSGELDLYGFDRFELALEAALNSDSPRVLIDLTDLEFIDSTGLQSLVRAKRRAGGDGRLRVTRGRGEVAAMFELTGLDRVLPFE